MGIAWNTDSLYKPLPKSSKSVFFDGVCTCQTGQEAVSLPKPKKTLLAAAVTNHKCHNHQPLLSIISLSVGWGMRVVC